MRSVNGTWAIFMKGMESRLRTENVILCSGYNSPSRGHPLPGTWGHVGELCMSSPGNQLSTVTGKMIWWKWWGNALQRSNNDFYQEANIDHLKMLQDVFMYKQRGIFHIHEAFRYFPSLERIVCTLSEHLYLYGCTRSGEIRFYFYTPRFLVSMTKSS